MNENMNNIMNNTMRKTMFKCVQHCQDDLEFTEEYSYIMGEPDNLIKSIVKGAFFRWLVRDKNWHERVE